MTEIGVGCDDHVLNTETAQRVERRADEIKGLIRTAQPIKSVAIFTHETCDATQGQQTPEGIHTRTLWGSEAEGREHYPRRRCGSLQGGAMTVV